MYLNVTQSNLGFSAIYHLDYWFYNNVYYMYAFSIPAVARLEKYDTFNIKSRLLQIMFHICFDYGCIFHYYFSLSYSTHI